jgi:hypothetical protein
VKALNFLIHFLAFLFFICDCSNVIYICPMQEIC